MGVKKETPEEAKAREVCHDNLCSSDCADDDAGEGEARSIRMVWWVWDSGAKRRGESHEQISLANLRTFLILCAGPL